MPEELARVVRQWLDENNLTLRSQRPRTGVSHVTMQEILMGVAPSMETCARLARGMGRPLNEILALAGHDPLPETGVERLIRGLAELSEEFGDQMPVCLSWVSMRTLTVEQAEAILEDIRQSLEGEAR